MSTGVETVASGRLCLIIPGLENDPNTAAMGVSPPALEAKASVFAFTVTK